jgi:hypothetical protein
MVWTQGFLKTVQKPDSDSDLETMDKESVIVSLVNYLHGARFYRRIMRFLWCLDEIEIKVLIIHLYNGVAPKGLDKLERRPLWDLLIFALKPIQAYYGAFTKYIQDYRHVYEQRTPIHAKTCQL